MEEVVPQVEEVEVGEAGNWMVEEVGVEESRMSQVVEAEA